MNTLINVVGPTAIGKTALAISLAQYFQTAILSTDSRQFFKEMTIGTAVPTGEELRAAPHYFVQHRSIHQPYSVGSFSQESQALLHHLFTSNSVVISVGGSGLYSQSLSKPLDYFPDIPPQLRIWVGEKYQEQGLVFLQNQLQKLDADYCQKADMQNPQRLMRALEVCLHTGQPYSSFLAKKDTSLPYKVISIGLFAPKQELHQRINARVDQMMEKGLLIEAQGLLAFRHLNALQTVGYRELFAFLQGESSLFQAIEQIKLHTRQFAKRQMTWFQKDAPARWFAYQTPHTQIIQEVRGLLSAD